jgi:protein-disulfide isomerase
MRFKWLGTAMSLVLLIGLIVACTPAEPEVEVNGDSAEIPAVKEIADSAEADEAAAGAETRFEVRADSLTTDANGVTVGFTSDGRAFKGNPDAPVLIEEYSDYQCPFCQRFVNQTMPGIVDNQIANGDAVLVFNDFPLTSIHPQAFAASRAARCAGEQGAVAYWDMHDQLFDTLGQWAVSDPSAQFAEYAATIGLESDAFSECFASDRYNSEVQADLNSGQGRGVTGTPAFFINGQLVSGAQPLSVFDQAIAASLSGEPVAAAQQPAAAAPQEIEMPTPAEFSDQYAFAMGDPDAPATIVEFTDYQCPFCARHSIEAMPMVVSEMIEMGRAYYILKDLPLDSLHSEARIAAAAARCAGEQDAYLDMHDILFANQQLWAGQSDVETLFANYATEISLDTDAFAECLASGRFDDAIEASVQEAQALGITGTPTFFIDGYNLFRGAQGYDVIDQIVTYVENGELEDRIRDAIERQNEAQQAAQQPPTPVPNQDVPIADSYSIGDPDAPVVIVEYTDYQCPFCSRHHTQTLPQIIQNYVDTGVVKYVFKDFPLTNIHPQAVAAAEAARCAGEQGSFVEMHNRVFETQQSWSGNSAVDTVFTGYAEEMGLDTTEFSECMSSDRHQEAIMADLREGSSFGVTGTPAFFVNGSFVSGAQPYSVFEQAIAAAQAAQ